LKTFLYCRWKQKDADVWGITVIAVKFLWQQPGGGGYASLSRFALELRRLTLMRSLAEGFSRDR